ncbi:MAG: response regulator [Bacteroidaceae bacterium]|jgi:CheY-like chemotaxis protein|nr:response regulator [Bacteroidaceae bacterium]MBR6857574.1 response regulator [Bacteroidaceae bacterium]
MDNRKDYSKYTVLIVDDIPVNIILLKTMLARTNVKILTAVNGQEALDIVRQLRPQVVLLDIQMPILNGLEVLKEIKADPNLKDIAVIMVSAYTSSEDIEQSMNLGASGFIKKPVIMDILLSTVTAELDKI